MTETLPPENTPQSRIARALSGALAITLGFVALRFLITPLRIKVVTTVLSPEDYGVVTLLSMTAHGLGLIVSAGAFELLLRRLPGLNAAARRAVYRAVGLISLLGGALASLLLVVLWNRAPGLGNLSARLSWASAVVLFLLFLLVQQRIYYLLGCHEHARARTLQLLWSDLWFLPVLALAAVVPWNAETAVWAWSGWLALALASTWRWIPSGTLLSPGLAPFSLKEIFRQSVPILPVLVGDWVFRLTGHYALLIHRDAAAMAFYALAMNVALTGQVAGVPLIDLCCVDLSKAMGGAAGARERSPSPAEKEIASRGVRHVLAVSMPVLLVLVFMPADVISFLAGPAFRPAAHLLPWAAPLPMLMLFNLYLARVLMLLGRSFWVAFGSILGAGAALALCAATVPAWGSQGALASIACAAALVNVLYAVELRAWRWLDRRFIHGPGLLAGAAILVGIFVGIHFVPGGALVRLAVAGLLALLTLVGTGCLRRADFHGRSGMQP